MRVAVIVGPAEDVVLFHRAHVKVFFSMSIDAFSYVPVVPVISRISCSRMREVDAKIEAGTGWLMLARSSNETWP